MHEIHSAKVVNANRERVRVADEQARDANHLQCGFRFSVITRGNHHAFGRRNRSQRRDRDLPRNERHHSPRRNASHGYEPHERRRHDEFVRERIEKLTEHTHKTLTTRKPAIEHVGQSRECIHARSPKTVPRTSTIEQNQHDRNHENPQKRQKVRNVACVLPKRLAPRSLELAECSPFRFC